MTMYLNHLQTMRLTFEEICQGQRPWTPLGNFMNDWYAYHTDRRPELVADPLSEHYPLEMHRWAVFCAATVEWFCTTYDVSCPAWSTSPVYILAEPWFFHDRPKVRQHLLTTTPEIFARRNIYCGDRAFKNKYEVPSLVTPQPPDVRLATSPTRPEVSELTPNLTLSPLLNT